MKPKEIQRALQNAGIKQNDLADRLEVDQAMISQIITGYRHTRYIQEAIAEIVGKPVEEIWPEERVRNLIKEARKISDEIHHLIKQKRRYRKAA